MFASAHFFRLVFPNFSSSAMTYIVSGACVKLYSRTYFFWISVSHLSVTVSFQKLTKHFRVIRSKLPLTASMYC